MEKNIVHMIHIFAKKVQTGYPVPENLYMGNRD